MRPVLTLVAAAIGALAATAATAQNIVGAGSTFAHPVLASWSKAYQASQADADFQPVGAGLDYEPIGSQAGLMRLQEAAVDFAATDVALSDEELTRHRLAQFPFVIGGIVVAANVEGLSSGQLRLTGDVLAGIFLGSIRSWQDERIKALNPDVKLPDAPIFVVRRSDGSGTTFNFTNYLSKVSSEWKGRVGEGLVVSWPLGEGAKGNEGMAERIKATRNAIGYLDFSQAQRMGLALAALRNRSGEFVRPSPASFQAAAAGAAGRPHELTRPLTDAEGKDAYPLVATTFAVLSRQNPPSRQQRAVLEFFAWSFANGSRVASDLGYVPLPAELVARNRELWTSQIGIRN